MNERTIRLLASRYSSGMLEEALKRQTGIDRLRERAKRLEEFSIFSERIEMLGLNFRTHHSLSRSGFKTVGDLLEYKDIDFMSIRAFGIESLRDLRETLAKFGLRLSSDRVGLVEATLKALPDGEEKDGYCYGILYAAQKKGIYRVAKSAISYQQLYQECLSYLKRHEFNNPETYLLQSGFTL